jgi:hypothetical protein
MPFIVGINKQYLHLINKNNKIIVYIDNDMI